MRSPGFSVSRVTFDDASVPATTTSEFFVDFTSMRPLPMLWMQTTGCPFTGKCFSKCCVAPIAGPAPQQNTPTPTSGRMLRPIVRAFISVYAPPAFHHRGQQFRFLLVRAGQIIARKIVARLLFHALFAVGNKLVDDVQVLAQRDVHHRTAQ